MSLPIEDKVEMKEPEKVTPTTDALVKKFAKVVLLAQDIKESSFDHKAADKAEKESDNQEFSYINFAQFYTKDNLQSIKEACITEGLPEELAYPIYLSFEWWNDARWWAQEMLGIEDTEQ